MPAIPSCIQEPLWDQFTALLPTRQVPHPLGCHRPRIPDRVVFDKLIQILVFGCGYRRIADHTCSATTLRRRRDEWIALGVADQLHRLTLAAYDRLHGLDLEHLAVDGCITKAPCGGQVAGPSPVDRRKQGLKRSVATEAHGVPLAALPAPANRRDDGLLAATLDAAAILTATAIGPLPGTPTVHLDAGYDYQPCQQVLADRGMVGQIATALVHRTPPGRGRVLVAAGLGAHRGGSAGPPSLDLLPLGGPSATPSLTACWRRPSPQPGSCRRSATGQIASRRTGGAESGGQAGGLGPGREQGNDGEGPRRRSDMEAADRLGREDRVVDQQLDQQLGDGHRQADGGGSRSGVQRSGQRVQCHVAARPPRDG